jgi:hypothetical protein
MRVKRILLLLTVYRLIYILILRRLKQERRRRPTVATEPAVTGGRVEMKQYVIRMSNVLGDRSMTIVGRDSGTEFAHYALTRGQERKEIAAMRRAIDRHLSTHNGTLGNYQW